MNSRRAFLLVAAAGVVAAYLIIATAAPLLTPWEPWKSSGFPLLPPSEDHPLGTDDLGRDIAACLLYGTRFTLLIGFLGAAIAVSISALAGIASGYLGGMADEIFGRVLDIAMTVPQFPLILVLALFFTPGIYLTAVIMGVLSGIHGIRVIRSQVLSLSQAPYIEAVRGIGAGDGYIMARHILPALGPLLSMRFIVMSQHFMLMGVGLGFLGLIDPAVVDWGQMISRASEYGGFSLGLWWWLVPPGIAISVLSIALGVLGTRMDEAGNPRLALAKV